MSNVKELNINNTTYDIIGKGVVDQNNATPLKQWSGTKAQYDAIATKDANTIYNITDDTNPTQTLLETIYPVGAIYIGTMNICPLSALFGTWTLISTKILTDIPSTLEAKGNGIALGLTDGSQNAGLLQDSYSFRHNISTIPAYGTFIGTSCQSEPFYASGKSIGITTDSTKSGIVANKSNKFLY